MFTTSFLDSDSDGLGRRGGGNSLHMAPERLRVGGEGELKFDTRRQLIETRRLADNNINGGRKDQCWLSKLQSPSCVVPR